MPKNLYSKGIFQCGRWNALDHCHRSREGEEERDQSVSAILLQSTSDTSLLLVEQDCKSHRTGLPKCKGFQDFPNYTHIHKPLNRARRGLYCKLVSDLSHFTSCILSLSQACKFFRDFSRGIPCVFMKMFLFLNLLQLVSNYNHQIEESLKPLPLLQPNQYFPHLCS